MTDGPSPSRALSSTRFGRLERIPASSTLGWSHEAHDFTPWLAENLALLGEELGLALELRALEHPVGRYSLDLLLQDAQERVVIVENQFGKTDHDHLGKLLTYCGGTEADVVIWIAETITEEHAAALEWLNENSVEGIGFFAVELEVLTIGDSLPAPHFRVVVQPNEWVKKVRPRGASSTDWGWASFADELGISQERLRVGRELAQRLEASIAERGLPWQPKFRKGYVAYQRAGGYNVALIDLYWARVPRLAIKLPATPGELGLESPYPALAEWWNKNEREWGWTIQSVDGIPDLGRAIDVARPYHPEAGPMIDPRDEAQVATST